MAPGYSLTDWDGDEGDEMGFRRAASPTIVRKCFCQEGSEDYRELFRHTADRASLDLRPSTGHHSSRQLHSNPRQNLGLSDLSGIRSYLCVPTISFAAFSEASVIAFLAS
jgi:hypothetical protein